MSGALIRHMGPRDAALVVLVACGFGSSFLFIAIAVPEVPPVTLACGRSIVSFLTLASIMWLTGYRLPRRGAIWWQLVLLGVTTQVVPMVLVAWGQQHIPSGLAGIILGSVPVVTLVFAHLLIADERGSLRSLLGALIGFAGVVAVIGRQALIGLDAHLAADLAVFGGAVSIAIANIVGRRVGHVLAPVVLATAAQGVSVAMLVPLSLAVDQPWTLAPSWQALGALVVLGTVGSAMPGFIFYRLLVRVGATRASLVAYLVPVVAVALGALFLDERLAWEVLVGLTLIVAGAMLVNQRMEPPTTGT